MSLALLDWFILAVLAGGVVRGFVVGAVRQITSLLGLVVAFVMAVQFMHAVGAVVVSSLGLSEAVGPLVGFIVVFGGVQLLFFGVSRLVEGLLDALSLTLLNRAAGGALGAFKAALLLSVLFLVLSGMEMPDEEVREDSVLYAPVARALPYTLDAASPYLSEADRAADVFRPEGDPDARSQAPPSGPDDES
jgi:membrane protein required for colicin V production